MIFLYLQTPCVKLDNQFLHYFLEYIKELKDNDSTVYDACISILYYSTFNLLFSFSPLRIFYYA